jgi:hypothetical protein
VNDNEPPFRRWWRRKSEARKGKEAPSPNPGKARPAEADFAHIDFDALDFNSDYARFILPDTPPGVRRRALRKLWASNAVFTTPDGLLDYAQDYSDAGVREGEPVQSAYRVGRGFMTDAEAERCATQVETAKCEQSSERVQTAGHGEQEPPKRRRQAKPAAGVTSAAGALDCAPNDSSDEHLGSDDLTRPNAKGLSRKPSADR